ncbi:long-chain-fatty-acid--CoA ligase [Longivirga aurantiaca]|uniref:Long-chain-fatty-acid--CoA ligase n=1 Tax=Longivirga aurantiaca TaxID=1837743 RepID=A0ABW1T575_9ACTN
MVSTPDRPWLAQYAPGVPAEIDVSDESLADLLATSVTRFADLVALDFYGATTTYRELGDQVVRMANVLLGLGVRRGDRVALVMPNCPQHVVAFYAALRLGAVVVEHNPLYTREELQHQFDDHGAEVAIAWDKVAGTLQKVAETSPLRTIIAVDITTALPRKQRLMLMLPVKKARETRAAMTAPAPGTLTWDRLLKVATPLAADHPKPSADDLALLQYTGGTTGAPKGAMLTHRNLRSNAAQGRAWMPGLKDGQEVVYGVLPLFHAYGLTLCLTFTISIGAVLVLFPRFDVDQVLEASVRRPATFLPAVPPVYQALAEASVKRGVDLSTIRYGISGAMSLPPATVEQWESVTGGLLVEGYGMTETSPVTLGNPAGGTRRPGSVGVPFPSTEVRVVDPNDPTHDVATDEPGELLVRGPQVMSGYWNRPEDTAKTLLEGGWIRTGDIVVMDDDGFVTVVDRIKELIITGGFNVYPSEVEEALRRVPGVADAAAVGLPNDTGGETVVAAVVAEGFAVLDPAAVREAVRESLTGYKVPRQVFVLDELPRSLIGKVLHRDVRKILESHPDRRT